MIDRRRPLARALSAVKQWGWRLLRRVADRIGFDIVWRDYYSAIPQLRELPPGFWDAPVELRGVEFDPDAHFDFLERELAPYIAEFKPPLDPNGDEFRYHLRNPLFGSVDAEVLYGMVRSLEPRNVVELGSGFSSLVIEAACERNADQGSAADYRIFDPFPWLDAPGRHSGEVIRTPATEVDAAEFERLGESDVLFVDTTHTVKAGGDVNHIVLNVLPALRPGVVVHFHDVFLPWQYPREWFEEMQWYWAEQYLLQAFLAFNSEFQILLAAHAMTRTAPDRLKRSVPSFTGVQAPASLWLRRRAQVDG